MNKRRKRHSSFRFFDTEEQARAFEERVEPHLRGAVTPWHSQDGTEHKWIAWYSFLAQ